MECGQSVCGIIFSDRLLLLVNENDGVERTWFGTNQNRCGHQVRSDRPLFGGIFILNLDNIVNCVWHCCNGDTLNNS